MKEIELKVRQGMPGALRAGQQVVEWVPIEYSKNIPDYPGPDFPREKDFLLFSKECGMFIGCFREGWDASYDGEEYWCCWWNSERDEEVFNLVNPPSHYMILPEPPTEGE